MTDKRFQDESNTWRFQPSQGDNMGIDAWGILVLVLATLFIFGLVVFAANSPILFLVVSTASFMVWRVFNAIDERA